MSYQGRKPALLSLRTGELVLPKAADISLATGTSNNLNIPASTSNSYIRFTLTGESVLTGVVAPTAPYASGKLYVFTNAGVGLTITLNNEDINSNAGNRFITGTGNDLTIAEGASVFAIYDDGASRWRIVGGSGSGSGSGTFKNYYSVWFDSTKNIPSTSNGTVSAAGNRTATDVQWASTNTSDISVIRSAITPLRGRYSYIFQGTTANAAGTTFVESPTFTLDNVDRATSTLLQPMYISFEYNGVGADGDNDLILVRYNSAGTFGSVQTIFTAAGQSATATPGARILSAGPRFFGYVPAGITANVGDKFAVRFRNLAAASVGLRITGFYTGPNADIGSTSQRFVGDKEFADRLVAREGTTVPQQLDIGSTTTILAGETRIVGRLDIASGTTINLAAADSYLVTAGPITGPGTLSGPGVIISV